MFSIKQKFSYSTTIFKVIGLDLEELKQSGLYRVKFWPFIAFFMHLIAVCGSILMIFWNLLDNSYSFRSDYSGILLLISMSTSATAVVVFTFSWRKTEQKLWKLLDEIDDFIVRFLEVKIDYRKENLQHFLRILGLLTLTLSIAASLRATRFSSSEKFLRYYGSAFYFAVLNQLNLNKFIFFVSILTNRLKVLAENFCQVKEHDCKLHTLLYVYSLLWRSIGRTSSRFSYPIIIFILNSLAMIMFFGFLLANMMLQDWLNFFHVFSLAIPQVTLWIICIYCNKMSKMVKFNFFWFF